jgi:hypothetical protein
MLVIAWMECVMVKMVGFSIYGICCGQKFWLQPGWNMSRSKLLVSAVLEYVIVSHVGCSLAGMCRGKNVGFSMAGMCHGENCGLQSSRVFNNLIDDFTKSDFKSFLDDFDIFKITLKYGNLI